MGTDTLSGFLGKYNYTNKLSRGRWAWEFLKRDPAFQDVAHYYAASDDISKRADRYRNVETLRLRRAQPEAEAFGLCFFPDPSANAIKANAFWSQYRFPRPVCVQVVEASPGEIDEYFTFALARCQTTHFTGIDGKEQFILRSEDCAIQIRSEGLSLLSAKPNRMRLIMDWDENFERKSKAILRAKDVYSGRGKEEQIWSRRGLELRNALICLDAKDAGLSYWEMAEIIYGPKHVSSDQERGSRSLKDAMRRNVQRGERLRNGGYTDLLLT